MPSLYITSYEWLTEDDMVFWGFPSPHVVGCIDARSLPECAQASGTTPPRTLFSLSQADANLDGYLGEFDRNTMDSPLRRAVVDMVEDRLQLPRGTIVSDTPRSVIAEVLTQHGDPTGQDRWKPLLSDHILLGGFSEIWRGDWKSDAVWREKWLEVRRHDFRQLKEQAEAGVLGTSRGQVFVPDFTFHLKVLGYWARRYRIAWQELVPPDALRDVELQGGPRAPETTITESFDTANSDTLGPDLTWTETNGDIDIVSNEAQAQVSESFARAESDLSGDDHYAQVKVTAYAGLVGPAVRFNSSADSCYAFILADDDINAFRIFKRTTGSLSQLAKVASGFSSAPFTAKLEVDASDLEGFRDDVSKISVQDMSFTGQTRCGFAGWSTSDTQDDFEAADLAAGTTIPIFHHHYQLLRSA